MDTEHSTPKLLSMPHGISDSSNTDVSKETNTVDAPSEIIKVPARTVGKVIQVLRTAFGLSQTELAERLGTNSSYLSQIENGHSEPGNAILEKIAEEFEIPLAILLIDKHDPNSAMYKDLQDLLGKVVSMLITDGKLPAT